MKVQMTTIPSISLQNADKIVNWAPVIGWHNIDTGIPVFQSCFYEYISWIYAQKKFPILATEVSSDIWLRISRFLHNPNKNISIT